MELIDTHCHLQFDAFDADRDEVVQRARDAGVQAIVTLATDLSSCSKVLELAETYPDVYAGVGIHPTDVAIYREADVERIRELAKHPRVVAIGEIGMDFYWDRSTADLQRRFFLWQLELAADLNLPVVIHNRRAGSAILDVLNELGALPVKGVFHCYSEGKQYASEVLERGFYISFTGNITYSKSKWPEISKVVPLERLLLETDSPFMTPVPHRGKRNEPAFVKHISEKHAAIREMDINEIAMMTSANARSLFNLPERP